MSWKIYKSEKANGKKIYSYIGGEGDGLGSLPPASESGPNPGSTAFLPAVNKTFWLDGNGDWVRTDGVTLSSIAVTTAPTKTTFAWGDTLDLAGIKVTATYSDDSTLDVTNACTYSPANGDVLPTAGSVTVNISYAEGADSETATQSITVTKELTGIAWTTEPTKTEYTVGDKLDLTGAVITASFNDGSTSAVTSSATFSPADESTLSDEGEVEITATYSTGGVTKTAKTKVTVAAAADDDT